MMTTSTLRTPFPFRSGAKKFMAQVTIRVRRLVDKKRSEFIPPENVQSYRHGLAWQAHYTDSPTEVSTVKELRHEFMVPMDSICDGYFSVLEDKIVEMSEAMHASQMRMMYELVSETSDRTGNVVSTAGKGMAEAFLETLEKIEFGVDKNGNPSLPSIHLGSEAFKKLFEDPQLKDPQFAQRVEDVKKRKIDAALRREDERLGRFAKSNAK